MEPSVLTLSLPHWDGNKDLECKGSILFVGANGSGKTRLGAWIELQSGITSPVHRISAQKSLSMPNSSTPKSIEMAERELIWGHHENNNKHALKWNHNPATALLNDYEKLMVYLFSEETQRNAEYKAKQKECPGKIEPPTTKMDLVKDAWERVLHHRELVIDGLRIQTKIRGASQYSYNASEMSDGERVIFYLLGQCLATPEDGVIIIDEPELHLHKSVQTMVWEEAQALRPDCLFIYLTHDVDFAAAQESSRKIWLKSYDGTYWDWEEVRQDDSLPEALLLEVLGSRQPVVFVEGENGSYDSRLYRELLTDYLVIPRGSCEDVIQSTKALRNNEQLHHLNVYGIVDRDRRPEEEISSLEESGIYVLNVAEVENLFCCEEVLTIVSERLERNADDDFENVKSIVFDQLRSEIDTQVSLMVSSEVKHQLSRFQEVKRGQDAITRELSDTYQSIDIPSLYMGCKSEIESAIDSSDYAKILKIYNRKSLAGRVSQAIGLRKGELPELVVRLARGEKRQEVKHALAHYFGQFEGSVA